LGQPNEHWVLDDAIRKFDVVAFFNDNFEDANKVGDEMVATCASCHDHEMSMNIRKKIGQCWKCGWKFNATKLIMKTLGITYGEAKNRLLRDFMMVLDRDLEDLDEEPKEIDVPLSLDDLKPVPLPVDFTSVLDGSKEGNAVIHYFAQRGLDKSICERYNVGYSFDFFYKFEEKKIRGFRDMAVIPVTYNLNPVCFTARSYRGLKVYRNSPEVDGFFSKKTVVFGLDQLEESRGFVCIGEGPFDAFSLPNGVSALGKTWSDLQISLLKNISMERVYIALDGHEKDCAISLAEKLVDYFQVFIVQFPGKSDPNNNILNIEDYLNRAVPYTDRISKIMDW
jgi:DNA primase